MQGENLFESAGVRAAVGKHAHEAPFSNPTTSFAAAKSVEKDVSRIAKRVFDALKRDPRACFEIEEDLDLSHQTASARITQLRKDGLIEDSGEKRRTRSMRQAIVWRVK